MTPETLKKAIVEARRFIEAAEKVEVKRRNNYDGAYEIIEPGAAPAACKRASMDLTRILAQLRGNK
jgi:hypothetical protein